MATKLLVLLIFALNLFGILQLPLFLMPFVFACIVNTSIFKPNPYKNIFFAFVFFLFLSFIPAYIYRGQGIIQSLTTSAMLSDLFYIIVFCAIFKLRPTVIDAQKVLVNLSIITSFIYIVQYILYPYGIAILPLNEDLLTSTSTEVARFRIAGSGIFSLAYFYGINQYILKAKVSYLLISFINIIPILLMGFRTMLAGIVLFSIIILIRLLRKRLIFIVPYTLVAIIFIAILMQVPAVESRISYMIEKQNEGSQTFANSDYIRWVQFRYFTHDHPKGVLDHILGSGRPNGLTEYGSYSRSLQDNGLHYNDWGIIGLSWIIGPFTVLTLLWLNLKAIRLIPNNRYEYIAIWFIYLIAISFSSMEYYRPGNYTIQALALYIAYKAYTTEKKRLRTSQEISI